MGKFTNKVMSDQKGLKALLKKLEVIDGAETSAGYDDTPHLASNLSFAELASIHEYGATLKNGGAIPPRPFMTEAAYHDVDSITVADTGQIVQDYLYGKGVNFRQKLTEIGRKQAENISYAFDTGNYIVTKNPTPLMDTWELREGAKYWVYTGKQAKQET